MVDMKIAVIGAGKVGSALGSGWAKAGHTIIFGVRDVNTRLESTVRANWRHGRIISRRGTAR
jgi:predicted dinucleotide-binding enzyme